MTDGDNSIAKIEKYFNNELDEAELKAFETRLEEDASFAKEVELFEVAMKGLDKAALKERLKEFHDELIPQNRHERSRRWYLPGIAASLALVIFAGYWIFFQPTDTNTLFNDYFEPYKDITNVRSSESDEFRSAMTYYGQGKYLEAIEQLGPFVQQPEYADKAIFYLGICHLAAGQEDEAIVHLSVAVEGKFYQQARWFLALSHLKSGDLAQMTEHLKRIEPNEFGYSQGQEILDKTQQ